MRRLAALLCLLAALGGCDPNAGRSPTEGKVPPPTEGASPSERAPIVVDAPKQGEELTSPAVISGTANVFEATVSYKIVADSGDVVAKGFTTATCGSGCRGTYSVTVPFEVDEPTAGTVHVFESSAKDGSAIHAVKIAVTLLP